MLENRQAELRGRYSFRIGGSTPFQTHLRDLYQQQRSNRNSLCSFFTDAIHFFSGCSCLYLLQCNYRDRKNQNGIRISNNHNHRLSGVFVRAIHPRTVTINHVLDGRAALCFIASGFISLLSEKRELERVKRKVHGDLS